MIWGIVVVVEGFRSTLGEVAVVDVGSLAGPERWRKDVHDQHEKKQCFEMGGDWEVISYCFPDERLWMAD